MTMVRCVNGHFYDKIKFIQCPFCGAQYTEKQPENFYPMIFEEAPHIICSAPSDCLEERVSDTYPSVHEEQLFMLYAGPPVRL